MTDINEIVGSGMSNEELIAQARELCEAHIKEIKTEIRYYDYQIGANIDSIRLGLRQNLNSWTTHLAEMDEHEGVNTDYGYVCQKCSKSFSQNGMTIRQYPCNFLVTKAKRLLGVE